MGFSRQEYWSRLPCPPPPGDLPDSGIEPMTLILPSTGRQVLYHWHHLGSPTQSIGRRRKEIYMAVSALPKSILGETHQRTMRESVIDSWAGFLVRSDSKSRGVRKREGMVKAGFLEEASRRGNCSICSEENQWRGRRLVQIGPFSSVAQSCPTLWDPMDCSTPGPPSITNSRSLFKLMSIELVMSSMLILGAII